MSKPNKGAWSFIFLGLVILIYIILFFTNKQLFNSAITDFYNTFVHEILFVLLVILLIMFILNLFLDKNIWQKLLKDTKNHTKYFISLVWWVLSSWPSYMWYSILEKLHEHWLSYGHIATFIYSRAVKIPFIFVMIWFFWLKFTIIFNLVLLLFSVIFWLIIDFIFRNESA